MKIGLIIPVYNHEHAIGQTVAALRGYGLPCILVDDGSSEECARCLAELAADNPLWVTLVRLPENTGKGGAVMAGFERAAALGWTHALQLDADGQHDSTDVPRFVALCEGAPDTVICGTPIYDDSVPLGRLYGRYGCHIWVWINTLSFQIRDSMCGFRIYPLRPVLELIRSRRMGRRMDFDIEVLVRLHWVGVPIMNVPTRVGYPTDGVSHFQLLRDNLRIIALHANLFFGMLRRMPLLIGRHFPDTPQ